MMYFGRYSIKEKNGSRTIPSNQTRVEGVVYRGATASKDAPYRKQTNLTHDRF